MLQNNSIWGSIPAELGSLTSLTDCWLYGNLLNGSIPSALGSLTKLATLCGAPLHPVRERPHTSCICPD